MAKLKPILAWINGILVVRKVANLFDIYEELPGCSLIFEQLEVAGITEVAATHYFQCGMVVKLRLKESPHPEARELLALMEIRPSDLSEAQRELLVRGIAEHALVEGDCKSYLRKEFKARFTNTKPAAICQQSDTNELAENPDPSPLLSVMAEEMRHRAKDGAMALWRVWH